MALKVQLADGSSYEIPEGERGTYPWVREASLIAKAYEQVGKPAEALKWQREYQKRLQLWDRAQAGEDMAAILKAAEPDLLAPLRIVHDLVSSAAGAAGKALEATGDTARGIGDLAKFLPVIVLGLVVILGLGIFRGNLGAKVSL